MAVLSSFEIIAENLVPAKIIPPGPSNPFALQGYWVQITNIAPGNEMINFSLSFVETTSFKTGTAKPAAEFIDANGDVNPYDDFLAGPYPGFKNQAIRSNQTLIYGVQALPRPTQADASFPQSGTGWRGIALILTNRLQALAITVTHRLTYYAGSGPSSAVISACVYPVPRF